MKLNKLTIAGIVVSFSICCYSTGIDREQILTELNLDPGGKTEVIKNFPDSFPEVLTARGEPIVYTRANSKNFEYIGMPIGGIGAGHLYLGGDGQLWFWDIFGLNYKSRQLKGEEAYQFPYVRSMPDYKGAFLPEQGFSISVKSGDEWVTKKLNRDGIKDIEFLGQYPIGEVSYRDSALPVEVQLEAFSPFVPLELERSILPATILNFTVKNTSKEKAEVKLSGWLENCVLARTGDGKDLVLSGIRKNQVISLSEGGLRIHYSAELNEDEETISKLTHYGTMSLALLGSGVTTEKKQAEQDVKSAEPLIGRLDKFFTLKPGEKKQASFILTWHFPVAKAVWMEEEWGDYKRFSTEYYAKVFKNAFAVSDHIIENFTSLTSDTRLWRDTWYDSTLPYWFLDRTFLNTSILASTTSHLIDDRLFYGTEGGNQGIGNCNHVYGYIHAMGRLFPDLEKSLREQVDFVPVEDGGALESDGKIKFRWVVGSIAVDGQAGCILRAYLCHQMSKDDTFLKRIYPNMKKAMQGLTEFSDPDHDGILTGPQHNTLDGTWSGKVTWLSLHYTTALRATAEMADDMGDHEYATSCRKMADKGRKYIEDHLFNGEYFIHESDPEHPESPGTYMGLEYSQLFGQSWAYQVGLGEVIDPVKAKTALESMWRYNFTTDVGPFREVHKPGRWYAMPGEGGIIACTWPRGGSEVLALGNQRYAAYNNECQNGYEYAATSLMMWHGMPYHSLAHIWYMHNDRYHGSKRNPWCEIEWGLHYSRSMASYGHFVATSGFEYHGPKGSLAFAPKITQENFRAAFTAAEGWGTFAQQRSGKTQRNSVSVKHGQLCLKKISLEVPAGMQVHASIVKLAGKPVVAMFKQDGVRVTVELKERITVLEEKTITIEMR